MEAGNENSNESRKVLEEKSFLQFVNRVDTSLDGIKRDMTERFSTLEERFAQTHDDIKNLAEVLIDVGRFETWRVGHEKVTHILERRLNTLEDNISKLMIEGARTKSNTMHNQKIIFLILSGSVGIIGVLLGFFLTRAFP